MKEITLDDVKELRKKFDAYTETAEQHEFPMLAIIDDKMQETMMRYEEAGEVTNQEDARAMFRVVSRIIGESPREYIDTNATEICWKTGAYSDDCICDECMHREECSASNVDNDDEE